METKRCVYCHKLHRADAQICSRCGHAFLKKKRTSEVSRVSSRTFSRPSVPAASPHRAGHYAGLHPEDQPYQSSKILAQRPLSDPTPLLEPEQIVLPATDEAPALKRYREELLPVHPVRQSQVKQEIETERHKIALPSRRLRLAFSQRTRYRLLTVASFLFLIASSIIAFAQIRTQPSNAAAILRPVPNTMRANDTFTLDGRGFEARHQMLFALDAHQALTSENGQPLQVRTNNDGSFSLHIRVPEKCSTGLHQIYVTDKEATRTFSTAITIIAPSTASASLQLAQQTLAFDAAAPGVVSNQTTTLRNSGGGQATWQANSDQPWLTMSPNNGSFAGSESVQVTVNRDGLAPREYTGHVSFTLKGQSTPPLQLNVTMSVKTAPAKLGISKTALNFTSNAGQAPADQTFVIQNTGGQPLHWRSNVTTGDGSLWLSLLPPDGTLPAARSAILAVRVQSQQLSSGTYTGYINLTGDAYAQLSVTVTVVAPGELVPSPASLAFQANVGQQPAGQSLTVQNSGGLALDWSASASTNDQGTWLHITPASGFLNAGEQATLSVTADSTGLAPGSYQGTITLSADSVVKKVAVSFTLVAPATPTATTTATPTPSATPTPIPGATTTPGGTR